MPRHHQYQQRDLTPEVVGDSGFLGVNMRLDPQLVPAGYASQAINCRFNRGIIETRTGICFPRWAGRRVISGSQGNQFANITQAVAVGGIITCTTAAPHGLTSGQIVTITWQGSIAIQTGVSQSYPVSVVDSTRFNIFDASVANGSYPLDLLTSLVNHWRLDETSGTRVNQIGGRDLSPINNPQSADGKINNGASFGGVGPNQSLRRAGHSTFEPTANGSWTVAFWFYCNTSTQMTITGTTSGLSDGWLCRTGFFGGTLRLFQFLVRSAVAHSQISTTVILPNVWNFAAIQYNSATVQLSMTINGVTQPVANVAGVYAPILANFEIGNDNTSLVPMNGVIDSYSIWQNRFLSSLEIAQLYNLGAGLDYPFTVGVGTLLGSGGGGITIGTGIVDWGTIYGLGTYTDPFTFKRYMIVASSSGVYYTSPNNIPYPIALPSGISITAPVTFTQAFNKLLMHRGPLLSTLELTAVHRSWTEVLQSSSGDGTETIPQSERSVFFQNRLFVPFGEDEIAVSDFNDYTRYRPVFQEFKINQGSPDHLVTIHKFNDITLIAFKESSIYAINNIYGDLSAAQLDEVTNQFGLVAAKSVAQVGKDLWFLSHQGVMSLTQTEENRLKSVVLPVSEPVQPLIERINWRYASGAVAAYWDNKYYLAVPLDDAERLGPELSPIGMGSAASSYTVPTVAGLTYRWTPGTGEGTLVNGTETLSGGEDFVAQGSSVLINFGSALTVGSSIRQVTTGVNNAVLVHDFLNRAWSGYDLVDGHDFQDFLVYNSGDVPRLYFASSRGYVGQYECGTFDDELIETYTDVTIPDPASIDALDHVQINDGDPIGVNGAVSSNQTTALSVSSITRAAEICTVTTASPHSYSTGFKIRISGADQSDYNGIKDITVTGGSTFTFVTTQAPATPATGTITSTRYTIGTSNPAVASANLFTDVGAIGFYAGNSVSVWSAPNTIVRFIAGGMRLISTNGLSPTVIFTVDVPASWKAVSTSTVPIPSSFISRQYAPENNSEQMYNWAKLDLALWNALYSLDLVSNTEREVFPQFTDRSPSRIEWYRPFDKTNFLPTNALGQAMDKFRKDYSIKLGNGSEVGEATEFAFYTTAGGVQTDLHAGVRETAHILNYSTGVQLAFDNTRGRFRCKSIILESAQHFTRALPLA